MADFQGFEELQSWLVRLPEALRANLLARAETLAQGMTAKIADEKLSGQVLNEKSGHLKASISARVEETGDAISARISAGADLPYAAIQEYGGTTKAHVIEAANGKVLAFAQGGKTQFFPHVNHPGSVIPEHDFMRSSLGEMQDEIETQFAQAVSDACNTN